MNILIAIISLFCYGDVTMKIHEQNSSPILSGDGSKRGQEVTTQNHARAAGEDAGRKKRRSCKKDYSATPPNEAPLGSRWIQLTKGAWALVDDSDYERVSQYEWMIETGGYPAKGNVLPNGTYGKMYLHYFIMNPPRGLEVDHKDGNRLDNRRKNLRIATRQQQCWNKGHSKNNKSGHKGISWHKKAGKWRAAIGFNWKQIHLGLFESLDDAKEAYRVAANKFYGEFARTS